MTARSGAPPGRWAEGDGHAARPPRPPNTAGQVPSVSAGRPGTVSAARASPRWPTAAAAAAGSSSTLRPRGAPMESSGGSGGAGSVWSAPPGPAHPHDDSADGGRPGKPFGYWRWRCGGPLYTAAAAPTMWQPR
ncbi:hypothetical protein I4F81_010322 [Pyropia yezoensis]|uniref:Uncharacterized protein n=1 Tax=Pyropia yezoensis TaxID=2788 RepID=A0ACC3CDA6_PYRYE|nr:hypothetical protein I4F81_010322 [Neopyropia yezoensis]